MQLDAGRERNRARGRRRNLVVLRAGDNSLHHGWLDAPARDFDLFVSYYGSAPGRHRHTADGRLCSRGGLALGPRRRLVAKE